jgi:uncharacterized integral membrane protein
MHTFLGLLGLLIFIACVIGLAAAMTALTVRISPTRDSAKRRTST